MIGFKLATYRSLADTYCHALLDNKIVDLEINS